MSMVIISSMTLSSLLMLPLMMQPLSLGLILMISTLLMCFISSVFVSSWYGYILFLIYVGGLLVMFAYVASLSPNILFGKAMNSIYIFFMMTFMFMMIINNYQLIDMSLISYLSKFNEMKFMKMYGIEMVSPKMISILISLAVILLINLIVVVKICYYHHASLRPFNN
uniref:NADH-ubiquinone oxidoreductase chain 6 n=1 Tax=Anentome sp. YY-2021 TaxID=2824862 RepID=A0A8A9WNC3_9CAEN|nr:NADH dehydrogenase subunit 6 [Anentome sp. YY-2021]